MAPTVPTIALLLEGPGEVDGRAQLDPGDGGHDSAVRLADEPQRSAQPPVQRVVGRR